MKMYKDVSPGKGKPKVRQTCDCNKEQIELMKGVGWKILTGEEDDKTQSPDFKLLSDEEYAALNDAQKAAYVAARDANDSEE